jgi:hypothetical protein
VAERIAVLFVFEKLKWSVGTTHAQGSPTVKDIPEWNQLLMLGIQQQVPVNFVNF